MVDDDDSWGTLWAGILPDRGLVTVHQAAVKATGARDERLFARLEAIIHELERTNQQECPQLAANDEDRAAVPTWIARMADPSATSRSSFSYSLGVVVPLAATVTLAAYVLLMFPLGFASVRRRPREAATLLLLTVAAITWRFVVAHRLPMVAATADMTNIVDAIGWLHGPFEWKPGVHPAGLSAILYWIFRAWEPSVDVAFASTTIIGGLVVVPVYLLAGRLGGKRAAWLAGLVYAGLPLSVIFSNGANMVIPAAFFLVASFVHLLIWTRKGRIVHGLLYVLSMALFVQMRPESAVEAVTIIVAHGVIAGTEGRLSRLLRQRGTWIIAAIGVCLVLPYGYLTVTHAGLSSSHADQLDHMAKVGALFAFTLIGLGVAWRWLGPVMGHSRLRPWLALAAVVCACFAIGHVLEIEGLRQTFLPSWPERLPLSADWHLPFNPTLSYLPVHDLVILDPRMFPLLWSAPWMLSLMNAEPGYRPGLSYSSLVLVLLAVMLSRYVDLLSGELIAEGFRYKVPTAGLLAVSVGLGLSWLVTVAPTGLRKVALIGVVLVSVLPLVSHWRIVSDADFNQQRQFQFLVQHITDLPEGSLLLVPDHTVAGEKIDTSDSEIIWSMSRTNHFMEVLRQTSGRPEEWLGFRAWLKSRSPGNGSVVFFHSLDCYRTDDRSESPDCRLIRTFPGVRPIAATRFYNRPYTRYPMIDDDAIEVSLLEIPQETLSLHCSSAHVTEPRD